MTEYYFIQGPIFSFPFLFLKIRSHMIRAVLEFWVAKDDFVYSWFCCFHLPSATRKYYKKKATIPG